MPDPGSLALPVGALVLAPLLLGIVNRTKAFIAGRRGPPLLQQYWDIAKYLRRGAVYGEVTSALFRLGPVVGLASVVAALLVTPFGGVGAAVSVFVAGFAAAAVAARQQRSRSRACSRP